MPSPISPVSLAQAHVHLPVRLHVQTGAPVRPGQREGGDARKMASGNANVIAFPDLPPKGSRGPSGKRALLGAEIGTLRLDSI
jgi:hypothetical protein